MDNTHFKYLLERYFHDSLTPDEWKKLLEYFRQEGHAGQLQEAIGEALNDHSFSGKGDEKQADRLFRHIMEAAALQEQKRPVEIAKRRIYKLSWLNAAAAVVVLLLLAGTWLWYNSNNKLPVRTMQPVLRSVARESSNDVAPGGNKAVLILANGSSIVLDSARNGMLAQQGNMQVLKFNGQLSYEGDPGKLQGAIAYNTIMTPRGGQYRVVLPDGTEVWLNAASSLRFPTAFAGTERKVELTGEAYFEVAKDKDQPFKVSAQGMEVKVLGTRFDVMAYGDEAAVKTTLLDGAVAASKGDQQVILKPGQQATVSQSSNNDIQVSRVDVEEATAWKDNLFLFNNTDIRSVMRELERWYDIDVAYAGNINAHLNGMISRNTNLSQVLSMLELTDEAHFKIEGKMVTVMP